MTKLLKLMPKKRKFSFVTFLNYRSNIKTFFGKKENNKLYSSGIFEIAHLSLRSFYLFFWKNNTKPCIHEVFSLLSLILMGMSIHWLCLPQPHLPDFWAELLFWRLFKLEPLQVGLSDKKEIWTWFHWAGWSLGVCCGLK